MCFFPSDFSSPGHMGVLLFDLPLVQVVSDLKCYVCVAHGRFSTCSGCMFLETVA